MPVALGNISVIVGNPISIRGCFASARYELDLRVVLLGTPAEEDGGGKELMLRAGAFEDVDFAIIVYSTPGMDLDCTGTPRRVATASRCTSPAPPPMQRPPPRTGSMPPIP